MKIRGVKTGVQVVVVKTSGHQFNLSRVDVYGAIGLAAFELGCKRPGTGRHLLLGAGERERWLDELEPAQTPSQ